MVYIPPNISQQVLGEFPRSIIQERCCGVCLGLSHPRPDRVFAALFLDMEVDVLVLDLRLPTFKTYDEREVASVVDQLANIKAQTQANGAAFDLQSLAYKLPGEQQPRILRIPMSKLYFLRKQFTAYRVDKQQVLISAKDEREIEQAFYRAIFAQMRLEKLVRLLARPSPVVIRRRILGWGRRGKPRTPSRRAHR